MPNGVCRPNPARLDGHSGGTPTSYLRNRWWSWTPGRTGSTSARCATASWSLMNLRHFTAAAPPRLTGGPTPASLVNVEPFLPTFEGVPGQVLP